MKLDENLRQLSAAVDEPSPVIDHTRFDHHLRRLRVRRRIAFGLLLSVTAAAALGSAIIVTRSDHPTLATSSPTEAAEAGLIPVSVLGSRGWESEADPPVAPVGTAIVISSSSELGEIWRSWRLPGTPPTNVLETDTVVAFVTLDGECFSSVDGLLQENGRLTIAWGERQEQDPHRACHLVSAPTAHMIAIPANSLPETAELVLSSPIPPSSVEGADLGRPVGSVFLTQ